MTSPHSVGGFHSSHWERLLRLEWHPLSMYPKNLRILKSNGFMKNTSEIFLHTSEIFFELYIDLSLCHLCRL